MRCRLSRRQRRLYDEYMTSAETRNTLAGGNFMGIISCLMQLRKVRWTSYILISKKILTRKHARRQLRHIIFCLMQLHRVRTGRVDLQ